VGGRMLREKYQFISSRYQIWKVYTVNMRYRPGMMRVRFTFCVFFYPSPR
jgi:hypothetical protein